MPDKQIIFVHGLGPKPEKATLLHLWRDALRHSLWLAMPETATTLAYWADLRERVDFSEPDMRAACRHIERSVRGQRWQLDPLRPQKAWFRLWAALKKGAFQLYLRLLKHTGPLISELERELARDYYLYFRHSRLEVRARLESELAAAAQAGKRTAVVCHSMGTVIAYDALYHNPGYEVDLLITMGSPLGFTPVQQDLCGAAHPPFPPNLRRWLNVFDGIDPITLPDQKLANDFTREGAQLIVDRMVRSNFGPEGERDPHHWFGYLTTSEVGDALSQFWIAP